ncbi:hypothetical protein STEG23_011916, partial [Scotinomys teguina]
QRKQSRQGAQPIPPHPNVAAAATTTNGQACASAYARHQASNHIHRRRCSLPHLTDLLDTQHLPRKPIRQCWTTGSKLCKYPSTDTEQLLQLQISFLYHTPPLEPYSGDKEVRGTAGFCGALNPETVGRKTAPPADSPGPRPLLQEVQTVTVKKSGISQLP